mgnify:CR=1 FL=1
MKPEEINPLESSNTVMLNQKVQIMKPTKVQGSKLNSTDRVQLEAKNCENPIEFEFNKKPKF